MFAFFQPAEKLPTEIENEAESVKNFLANSYYFQQMKLSAGRYVPGDNFPNFLQWRVDKINSATSYSAVMHELNNFDVDNSDDLFPSLMGRNKMSVYTRIIGTISENAYFCHVGIELLREVEEQNKKYLRFLPTVKYVKEECVESLLIEHLPATISDVVIEYAVEGSSMTKMRF